MTSILDIDTMKSEYLYVISTDLKVLLERVVEFYVRLRMSEHPLGIGGMTVVNTPDMG